MSINRRQTLVVLGAAAAAAVLPASQTLEVGKCVALATTTPEGSRGLLLAKIVAAIPHGSEWRYEIATSPVLHTGRIPDDLWNRIVAGGAAVAFEPGERGGFISRQPVRRGR